MENYLLLKWGSLKEWQISEDSASFEFLKKWIDIGVSMSAICQNDTNEQKKILCELIDSFDGEIANDWDGETYTKEQAKNYIMNYGK